MYRRIVPLSIKRNLSRPLLIFALIFVTSLYYSYRKLSSSESSIDARLNDNLNRFVKFAQKDIEKMYNTAQRHAKKIRTAQRTEKTAESTERITTEKTRIKKFKSFDLLLNLSFDNIDGGAWKQGWDVKVNSSRWSEDRPLKVFIMPVSHCDVGWLKTPEVYYSQSVENILNNIVDLLNENENRRFVWSEVYFLSMWWQSASDRQKSKMKRIISNGQFEIVSGGWVMNDEAITHYSTIIDQLMFGHRWLKSHIGDDFRIKTSMSYDIFGHSATMPFLLFKSGFKNLIIHRIHYSIKKFLAKNKLLEFKWQQLFNQNGPLTHTYPFFSYDVPHTCGSEPSVCCQFDFERYMLHLICPWDKQPIPLSERNLGDKAYTLLNQYRKKAELFRGPVLIPLGDDFRYQNSRSARFQIAMYEKLIAHMNKQKGWHVEVKFATASEYFDELQKNKEVDFPVFFGDFFPYADKDLDFWTGYFTSRPYLKSLGRVLQAQMRTAEILHSYATIYKGAGTEDAFGKLHKAREILSLYVHHDSITGTSPQYVIDHLLSNLKNAIDFAEHVAGISASRILSSGDQCLLFHSLNRQNVTDFFMPRKLNISDNSTYILYVFNPSEVLHEELVTVLVNNTNAEVVIEQNKSVPSQISPFWINSKEYVELSFLARVPALSFKKYMIRKSFRNENYASIKFAYRDAEHAQFTLKPFPVSDIGPLQPLIIENDLIRLTASNDGFLESISLDGTTHAIKTKIIEYVSSSSAFNHKAQSGAYLFIADNVATDVVLNYSSLYIVNGPVYSAIVLHSDTVVQRLTLLKTKSLVGKVVGTDLYTTLSRDVTRDLALRLEVDIDNSDGDYYTDSNGFQLMRRRYLKKLSIQGNVYPMTSSVMLYDSSARLNILSQQPRGVSSLRKGEIDIFLDRMALYDDNRGMNEGLIDVTPAFHSFQLFYEKNVEQTNPSLSLQAQHLLNQFTYPFDVYFAVKNEPDGNLYLTRQEIPSDLHLVNLKVISNDSLAMILRRYGSGISGNESGPFQFKLSSFFDRGNISSAEKCTLTLMECDGKIDLGKPLPMGLNDVCTYKLFLK